MLRKSYRNVRNSSRTKKIGQMRVNRGFSGIREAPNAPDLGSSDHPLAPLPAEKGSPAGAPIDRHALANIAALQRPGSPPVLPKVISMYLKSSGELLEKLARALEEGDAETTRRTAHTLKSSSANVGASRLASLSKQLEDAGRSNSLQKAGLLLEQIKAEHGQVVAALQEELEGVANA